MKIKDSDGNYFVSVFNDKGVWVPDASRAKVFKNPDIAKRLADQFQDDVWHLGYFDIKVFVEG